MAATSGKPVSRQLAGSCGLATLPMPDDPLIVPRVVPNTTATSGRHSFFSLVVPTYNERMNIEHLLDQIIHVLDDIRPGSYELIIVDDDSPDETFKVVADWAQRYAQIKLLHRVSERGLATAVVRGWQASTGDVLGVMDGDRQHPPQILADLLERIDDGADLAIASRYLQEEGFGDLNASRRMTAQLARVVGRVLLPGIVKRTSDPGSGFFLLRREVIAGRVLSPSGYKILLEVLGRGSVRQLQEVPFVFQARQHGQTKLSVRQCLEYLWHLARLRLFA